MKWIVRCDVRGNKTGTDCAERRTRLIKPTTSYYWSVGSISVLLSCTTVRDTTACLWVESYNVSLFATCNIVPVTQNKIKKCGSGIYFYLANISNFYFVFYLHLLYSIIPCLVCVYCLYMSLWFPSLCFIIGHFSVKYYTNCVSLKSICASLNVKLCIFKNHFKQFG